MLTLHVDPITVNCRKVLAGLQLIGVEYKQVTMSIFSEDHKEDSYLALNPNGTMPLMTEKGFCLWESNAILQYAADVKGDKSIYPSDPQIRADISRWLLWESANWFPSCYVYMVENVAKPLMGLQAEQSLLDNEAGRFNKLAAILDSRLANQQWLCGDNVTIADIAVAAPMHLHQAAKLPLKPYKYLLRWMTDNIEQLQCWKNTYVGPDLTLEQANNQSIK